jgi:hypothetical protein
MLKTFIICACIMLASFNAEKQIEIKSGVPLGSLDYNVVC